LVSQNASRPNVFRPKDTQPSKWLRIDSFSIYDWFVMVKNIVHFLTLAVCVYKTFTVVMEQHAFKNVNNGWSTNIYSYSETAGGQSFKLYLNVVHFFNTSAN
jgi:hypothetical protein